MKKRYRRSVPPCRGWLLHNKQMCNCYRGDIAASPHPNTAGGAKPDDAVERDVQFWIDEREDDMLICGPHWQFGSICMARRPKLLTNDQWRPVAQRIVAALTNSPEPTGDV